MSPSPGTSPVVPRTVKGLALVSLFNDFASEMIYPLLPAFITRVLGGNAVMLGALDGAADLTASMVRWFSGRLADRPGWRKPLILGGYLSAVLIRPLISVASAAWQVVGFRVLDRIGKGLRSPARDALVAQVTAPAARGRAFGFHRAADHLGAVAGSVAAWVLLSRHADVRQVIAMSAIPGVVAFGVLAVVLRGAEGQAGGWSDVRAVGRSDGPMVGDAAGRSFWQPVAALVFLTVGRLPEALILLRLQDMGVAIVAVPLAWAALHVVRTLAAYPGGWLSDHLGPRGTIALGGVVFAGVILALAAALPPALAVATFLALGLVTGLTEAAERAVVAQLAPIRMGSGFGSWQALAGLAALPAALLFGWVYQAVSGPAALAASAGAVGLGTAAWLALSAAARRPA